MITVSTKYWAVVYFEWVVMTSNLININVFWTVVEKHYHTSLPLTSQKLPKASLKFLLYFIPFKSKSKFGKFNNGIRIERNFQIISKACTTMLTDTVLLCFILDYRILGNQLEPPKQEGVQFICRRESSARTSFFSTPSCLDKREDHSEWAPQ